MSSELCSVIKIVADQCEGLNFTLTAHVTMKQKCSHTDVQIPNKTITGKKINNLSKAETNHAITFSASVI